MASASCETEIVVGCTRVARVHATHAQAAARDWFGRRTLHESDADLEVVKALRAASGLTISVVLPALNEQDTVGEICARLSSRLVEAGIVQQLLVVDSGSEDDTATVATAAGASVAHVRDILPELPVIGGKGEALWRSLAVATGDLVVYLDSDVRNSDESFVLRLIEPLLRDPGLDFVKAFYERPLGSDNPIGGGRVTELVARPLINLFYPELGGFIQPLAGEYAARRRLLKRVPFFCGYAVEVGLLIDILETVGLDRMSQVDLGERMHRNRPTAALGPMAFEIIKAVLTRVEVTGRAKFEGDLPEEFASIVENAIDPVEVKLQERPPMSGYPDGSSGGGSAGGGGVA